MARVRARYSGCLLPPDVPVYTPVADSDIGARNPCVVVEVTSPGLRESTVGEIHEQLELPAVGEPQAVGS